MCWFQIGTAVGVAGLMTVIGVARIASSAHAADNRADQVTVPRSALNSLIGEPDRQFHRAADLYAKGNTDGAASEIRAAAALIRLEAGRGSVRDPAKLQAGSKV